MADGKPNESEASVSCCACKDSSRRRLLGVTAVLGSGLGLAATTPFVASLLPVDPPRSGRAAIEVDIASLPVGQILEVSFQGKPVWVLKRSSTMVDALRRHEAILLDPASEHADQPACVKGAGRSIRDDIFVCIGLCTHLECIPSAALESGERSGLGEDWPGGFICPCHGARFDLAGRVFKGSIASKNLSIPPYSFLADNRLLIGEASA